MTDFFNSIMIHSLVGNASLMPTLLDYLTKILGNVYNNDNNDGKRGDLVFSY